MEAFLHDLSWVPPLRTELLTHSFNGFTFLGYLPFFLIFLPMGYWLGDKGIFTRLVVLVGIVALTNSFLKDLFQDPRPDIQFAIDKRVGDSFGFPSGHSQIAVAMWLWLALEARRTWVWILAAIVATGVCFSRLYLGVHDVEDVLGGALLGVATVVIYAGFLSPEFERLQKLPLVVWLVAIAALVPILWQIWPYDPRSQAIPGVAALMLSYFPTLTPLQVRDILVQSVRTFPTLRVAKPGDDGQMVLFSALSKTGGLLDAFAAIKLALQREAVRP